MTSSNPFNTVLVANRGEIAVRILRTCRELGLSTVAVYSDADADAMHVRHADEAIRLGPGPATASYLDTEAILSAARASGAQAVHPGYGFLSESADFARAVTDAGLTFIGPDSAVIAQMGDKIRARQAAMDAGVPLLDGYEGDLGAPEKALDAARAIGFPLMIKARFGGGGRGMRIARTEQNLTAALEAATREATGAFGRGDLYLERYVEHGRHVEVQVFGDAHGSIVHLWDRDCTVQRRHQKLLEEAPADNLPEDLRTALLEAALTLARHVGYRNAGTVEFLVDRDAGTFHFLEMNTRLQVEHGVTELVTGVDLVQWQIAVAMGDPLPLRQDDITVRGHAIQARISAEDPWSGFLPATGDITRLDLPNAPGLRLDFGVEAGDAITPFYDSMFGKVLALGADRPQAARKLAMALEDLHTPGLPTTAPFLRRILHEPAFLAFTHTTGAVDTLWMPETYPAPAPDDLPPPTAETEEIPMSERLVTVHTLDGALDVRVPGRVHRSPQIRPAGARTAHGDTAAGADDLAPTAPIDGTVVKVEVSAGARVSKGTRLVVLEAMKMELPVLAGQDGTVSDIQVAVGDVVARGLRLLTLDPA